MNRYKVNMEENRFEYVNATNSLEAAEIMCEKCKPMPKPEGSDTIILYVEELDTGRTDCCIIMRTWKVSYEPVRIEMNV